MAPNNPVVKDAVQRAERKPEPKIGAGQKSADWFAKLRQLHDAHRIPPERLETTQKLGEGGFAVVDLAWYTKDDGTREQVAVKRVKAGALKMTTQLKLFANESEIMCRMKHKNCVALLGIGSQDYSTNEKLRDTIYLVEELLSGGSLRRIVLHQMIHAPAQLYRIKDAVRWSMQMAEALEYMHGMDPVVVHRDLKPDNILLTSDDPFNADVKLADFGLSVMIPNKHVQAEAKSKERIQRNLARESKWNQGMAPTSKKCLVGANAMLGMIEGGLTEVAGYDALAPPSTALDHYGGPHSRTSAPRSNMPRSRAGPYSKGGPTSKLTSRNLLSSLMNLGGGSKRNLEVPSAVMFDLTSMTGSLLYMAPEVFKGEPYNYKADVFSFGMVMYEILHQKLIMATLIAQQMEDRNVFENEIMEFTKSVSVGYRPPIEDWLPDYMKKLLTDCWAQKPPDRPPMKSVVEVLKRFAASPELAAIDKSREPSCCVIS